MSFSTASGEAPGYCTLMKTNGKVMSGMRSTRSRLYEKTPSTSSATITMVANTGWLMLVLVIHMAGSPIAAFTAGAALMTAGVPGLSPETRALTTAVPFSSPLRTSTRPPRGSVAPSLTARLPILPPSMVKT